MRKTTIIAGLVGIVALGSLSSSKKYYDFDGYISIIQQDWGKYSFSYESLDGQDKGMFTPRAYSSFANRLEEQYQMGDSLLVGKYHKKRFKTPVTNMELVSKSAEPKYMHRDESLEAIFASVKDLGKLER